MSVTEQGGSMILCGYDTQVFKNHTYGDFLVFANDAGTQRLLMGLCNVDEHAMITIDPDAATIQRLKVASNTVLDGNLAVMGNVAFCNADFQVTTVQNAIGPVNVNGALIENGTVTAQINTNSIISQNGSTIDIQGITVSNETIIARYMSNESISTSNLYVYGPTTVSGDILPDINSVHSIGSSNLRFKELYLDGNSIHLGDSRIESTTTGVVSIVDDATDLLGTIQANQFQLDHDHIMKVAPNGKLRFYALDANQQYVLDTPIPNVYSAYDTEFIGIGTSNPEELLTLKNGNMLLQNGDTRAIVTTGTAADTLLVRSNLQIENRLDVPIASVQDVTASSAQILLLNARTASISNVIVESSIQTATLHADAVLTSFITAQSQTVSSINVLTELDVLSANASNLYAESGMIGELDVGLITADDIVNVSFVGSNITTSNLEVTSNILTDSLKTSDIHASTTTTLSLNVAADTMLEGTVTSTSVFNTNIVNASNATISGDLVSESRLSALHVLATHVHAENLTSTTTSVSQFHVSNVDVTDSFTMTAPVATAVNFSISNLFSSNLITDSATVNSIFTVTKDTTLCNLVASNMLTPSLRARTAEVDYVDVNSNLSAPVVTARRYLNVGRANIGYPNVPVIPDIGNATYFTDLSSYTGPSTVSTYDIFATPADRGSPVLYEGDVGSIHRYLAFKEGDAIEASGLNIPFITNSKFSIGLGFRLDTPLELNQEIRMMTVDFVSGVSAYSLEWIVYRSFQSHQVSVDIVQSGDRTKCVFNIEPGKWYYMLYVKDNLPFNDITLYSSAGTIYTGEYALTANTINVADPQNLNMEDINTSIVSIKNIKIENNALNAKQFSFASAVIYKSPQQANVREIIDFMSARCSIRTHTMYAISNLVVGGMIPSSTATMDVQGDINLTGDLYYRNKPFRQTPFSFTPDKNGIYLIDSNIGINTQNPQVPLHVVGNTDATRFRALSHGTFSSPAFTWSNNSNTGMYLDTSNQIAFTIEGKPVLYMSQNETDSTMHVENITSTGDIAANNISVTELTVASNLNFNGLLLSNNQPYKSSQFDTSLDKSSVFLTGSNLVLGSSNFGALSNTLTVMNGIETDNLTVNCNIELGGRIIYRGEQLTNSQWYTSSNNSNVYIVDSNVGIGTSRPDGKLHVVGDSTFEGDIKTNRQMQITGLRIAQTNPTGSPMTVTSTVTSIPGFMNNSETIDYTLCNTQTHFRFRDSNLSTKLVITESGDVIANSVVHTPQLQLINSADVGRQLDGTLPVTGLKWDNDMLQVYSSNSHVLTFDAFGLSFKNPITLTTVTTVNLEPNVVRPVEIALSDVLSAESSAVSIAELQLAENMTHVVPHKGVYSLVMLVECGSTTDHRLSIEKNNGTILACVHQASTSTASLMFTGTLLKDDIVRYNVLSSASTTANVTIRISKHYGY